METARVYVTISLILITIALIFHLVAMGYPRWKLIENRRSDNLTVHIGLFDRCEDLSFNNNNLYKKTYSQCDSNKYLPSNSNYTTALCRNVSDENCQKLCNKPNNNYSCDYLRFTKGLIACTIVAACMIGLALITTYSNLLINAFKYKTHLFLSFIAFLLLLFAFAAILTALILVGSFMQRDLFEYRYSLSNQLKRDNLNATQLADREQAIRDMATRNYNVRLDWSAGLEIASLIMTSFSLITQLLYLFRTWRSQAG